MKKLTALLLVLMLVLVVFAACNNSQTTTTTAATTQTPGTVTTADTKSTDEPTTVTTVTDTETDTATETPTATETVTVTETVTATETVAATETAANTTTATPEETTPPATEEPTLPASGSLAPQSIKIENDKISVTIPEYATLGAMAQKQSAKWYIEIGAYKIELTDWTDNVGTGSAKGVLFAESRNLPATATLEAAGVYLSGKTTYATGNTGLTQVTQLSPDSTMASNYPAFMGGEPLFYDPIAGKLVMFFDMWTVKLSGSTVVTLKIGDKYYAATVNLTESEIHARASFGESFWGVVLDVILTPEFVSGEYEISGTIITADLGYVINFPAVEIETPALAYKTSPKPEIKANGSGPITYTFEATLTLEALAVYNAALGYGMTPKFTIGDKTVSGASVVVNTTSGEVKIDLTAAGFTPYVGETYTTKLYVTNPAGGAYASVVYDVFATVGATKPIPVSDVAYNNDVAAFANKLVVKMTISQELATLWADGTGWNYQLQIGATKYAIKQVSIDGTTLSLNLQDTGVILDKGTAYTLVLSVGKTVGGADLWYYVSESKPLTPTKGGVNVGGTLALSTSSQADALVRLTITGRTDKSINIDYTKALSIVNGTTGYFFEPKLGFFQKYAAAIPGDPTADPPVADVLEVLDSLKVVLMGQNVKYQTTNTIAVYYNWSEDGTEFYYSDGSFAGTNNASSAAVRFNQNTVAYTSVSYVGKTLKITFVNATNFAIGNTLSLTPSTGGGVIDAATNPNLSNGTAVSFRVDEVSADKKTVTFTQTGNFNVNQFTYPILRTATVGGNNNTNVWGVPYAMFSISFGDEFRVGETPYGGVFSWYQNSNTYMFDGGSNDYALPMTSGNTLAFRDKFLVSPSSSNNTFADVTWTIKVADTTYASASFATTPERYTTLIPKTLTSWSTANIRFQMGEENANKCIKGHTYSIVIEGTYGEYGVIYRQEMTGVASMGANTSPMADIVLTPDLYWSELYPDGITKAVNIDVKNGKAYLFFNNWYVEYAAGTKAYIVINGKLYNATIDMTWHPDLLKAGDSATYYWGVALKFDPIVLPPNDEVTGKVIIENPVVAKNYILDTAFDTKYVLDGLVRDNLTSYVSGPTHASNGADKLFDDLATTKYDSASAGLAPILFKGAVQETAKWYSFTTANDTATAGKIPTAWKLYGSATNIAADATGWVLIDTVDVTAADTKDYPVQRLNSKQCTYEIDNPDNYAYYKIEFTKNDGGVALSKIDLYVTARTYRNIDVTKTITMTRTGAAWGNDQQTPALFDGNRSTKFLVMNRNTYLTTPVMFNSGENATTLIVYAITNGNDNRSTDRQLKEWKLYASNSNLEANSTDWILIDHKNLTTPNNTFINNQNYQGTFYTVDNPGSYRYYKLQFLDAFTQRADSNSGNNENGAYGAGGGSNIQIGNIQFFGPSALVNQTGAPAYDSTKVTVIDGPTDDNGSVALFDNNVNTKLGMYNDNWSGVVTIKTETAITLQKFDLYTGGDSRYWNRPLPGKIKIEASLDGTTWVTIFDMTDMLRFKGDDYTPYTFYLPTNTTAYSNYKITFNNNGNAQSQISEMVLYAPEAVTTAP